MFVLPELYNDVCMIEPQKFLHQFFDGPTRVVRIAPKHLRKASSQHQKNTKSLPEYSMELKMDVRQFQPEEITVKLEQNKLVIVAQHEEQNGDVDSFANYMVRKTQIPEDADVDGIVSKFSKDGILTVTVPKKEVKVEDERIIPIIRTNEMLRVEKTVGDEKNEAKRIEVEEGKDVAKNCGEDKKAEDASST